MKRVLLCIAMVLLVSFIQAETLSYQDSYSLHMTNFDNVPLSVHQFDASLGTLNYVLLELTGSVKADATITNTANDADTIDVQLQAEIKLFLQPSDTEYLVVTPSAVVQNETLGAGETKSFNDMSGNATSQLFINSSNMTPFLGTGTTDFQIDAIAQTVISGSGNLSTTTSTSAGAVLTVTYNYSVEQQQNVPEPASLFMLAMGLFGLASVARRKF